ncbi:MAG: chitobiase/beta-hexosaminidase C-terminal domain-containing protein [Bacteroidia bacterium]|nr:chitobiase/beta-hexosaminidase C-terminal domain-containing protein [Bacteroidia bacterium]
MVRFKQLTLNLVYFANTILVFLLIFEEKVRLPVFLQVTGRMHPMILHFPIALLFVGIFMHWLNSRKSFQHQAVHEITQYVFCIYALGSALTALFGFFLYTEGSYTGEEISLHKWIGVAVSLLAVPVLMITEKSSIVFVYGILGTSVVCITLTGHLGSEITHGKGFLTEPIRKQREARIIQIENPDSAIVFRDVIQPILNEKCLNCHNTRRAKNKLILDSYQSIMEGGKNPSSIVAGKAAESLVFKYVSLPLDDTLHMPPNGKLQLEPDEIKLLGWWINSGASDMEKYVTFPKVDSIHSLMLSRFQPKKGLDLEEISFADQSTIEELNNPYRTVQQIAVTKPYVAVFLGSKQDFSSKDLIELKAIRDQVTSIDLGNSKVKDSDLENLTQFRHLQKLHLQNIAIGDAGVHHLKKLPYLESLNLSGTNISAKTIEEISTWENLKKLYLYNTAVTVESIQTLKNTHPKLEVYNTRFDLTDSLYTVQLTTPISKIDSIFFHVSASVEIKQSRGNVKYFYTLDGTKPTLQSNPYQDPFKVNQSAELKIMAMKEEWIDSKVATFPLMKLGITPARIVLETKPDTKFSAKKDSVLIDGKPGSLDRGDKAYLAFVNQDLQAVFELNNSAAVSQLTLSFLENVEQGVLAPEYIEVWGGESMNALIKLGRKDIVHPNGKQPVAKGLVILNFPDKLVKFIRLKAKNPGRLPPGLVIQKTAKASIFIDEVAFN